MFAPGKRKNQNLKRFPGWSDAAKSEIEILDRRLGEHSRDSCQSLTCAVADKLREMIIRGEIQEGEQLRQDALADEFQVSHIPIRKVEGDGSTSPRKHRLIWISD